MKIIIDARFLDMAKQLFLKEENIYPSYIHQKIQEPLSAHPDMTIVKIGETFVCAPESYEHYKGILNKRVVCGKTALSFHYPYDIAYNVLIYKNKAFGKEEYIDSVVKDELKRNNIELINVNQGYAKCSCCVCDKGVITADNGIYEVLLKNGINALKIAPKHVKLSGYDYGFIGGASGEIDGRLTFFGDVSCHPDFLKIRDFCDFDYFREIPLTDVGTIISI